MITKDYFINKKNFLIENNLKPNPFLGKDQKEYEFEWIIDCPTNDVLNLRNAKEVLINMHNSNKISPEKHNNFIINYRNISRIDFIIKSVSNQEYVGGVNIVENNKRCEIGKYIGNSSYLGLGIAKNMTKCMIDFFHINFPEFKQIFSVTKATNISNINLNKKIGFEIVLKIDEVFILMKKDL